MKPSLIALFAFVFILQGCHVITPIEMTRTAIGETFYRIHLFMQKEGKAPPALDVLPRREGYGNRTTDGWGRELAYSQSPDGVLSLKSLGRDGWIGGTGEDADISRSYRTIDENGRSLIGDDLWIVTAEIKIPSEQAGAGQPATRSDSDSEGDDKPQPEAEGRFR
jgi:hypothetical protein